MMYHSVQDLLASPSWYNGTMTVGVCCNVCRSGLVTIYTSAAPLHRAGVSCGDVRHVLWVYLPAGSLEPGLAGYDPPGQLLRQRDNQCNRTALRPIHVCESSSTAGQSCSVTRSECPTPTALHSLVCQVSALYSPSA